MAGTTPSLGFGRPLAIEYQHAELVHMSREQLLETCVRLDSRRQMMEILHAELQNEKSKLLRHQSMLSERICRVEGSMKHGSNPAFAGADGVGGGSRSNSATDSNVVGVESDPKALSPIPAPKVSGLLAKALPVRRYDGTAIPAGGLVGGSVGVPVAARRPCGGSMSVNGQISPVPVPASGIIRGLSPVVGKCVRDLAGGSGQPVPATPPLGNFCGGSGILPAAVPGVPPAVLRERLEPSGEAQQLSAPEEVLLKVSASGVASLTWFYNEQVLEQLQDSRHPLRRLSFEVRQQSEGANGRMRTRSHMCDCRIFSEGEEEIGEQGCEIDGCIPGKAYAFSVRAKAEFDGRASPSFSPFSETVTLGAFSSLVPGASEGAASTHEGVSTAVSTGTVVTPRAVSAISGVLGLADENAFERGNGVAVGPSFATSTPTAVGPLAENEVNAPIEPVRAMEEAERDTTEMEAAALASEAKVTEVATHRSAEDLRIADLDASRRRMEEEMMRHIEGERRKLAAEKERFAEEARRREEEATRHQEAAEQERQRQEQELHRRLEEIKRKAEEEEERRRIESEVRRKLEEEDAKRNEEMQVEARRRLSVEASQLEEQRRMLEEERKRQQAEEARIVAKAAEEERQREEALQRRLAAEILRRSEADARRRAEEEARRAAELEERRTEEARERAAEAEATRRLQEEEQLRIQEVERRRKEEEEEQEQFRVREATQRRAEEEERIQAAMQRRVDEERSPASAGYAGTQMASADEEARRRVDEMEMRIRAQQSLSQPQLQPQPRRHSPPNQQQPASSQQGARVSATQQGIRSRSSEAPAAHSRFQPAVRGKARAADDPMSPLRHTVDVVSVTAPFQQNRGASLGGDYLTQSRRERGSAAESCGARSPLSRLTSGTRSPQDHLAGRRSTRDPNTTGDPINKWMSKILSEKGPPAMSLSPSSSSSRRETRNFEPGLPCTAGPSTATSAAATHRLLGPGSNTSSVAHEPIPEESIPQGPTINSRPSTLAASPLMFLPTAVVVPPHALGQVIEQRSAPSPKQYEEVMSQTSRTAAVAVARHSTAPSGGHRNSMPGVAVPMPPVPVSRSAISTPVGNAPDGLGPTVTQLPTRSGAPQQHAAAMLAKTAAHVQQGSSPTSLQQRMQPDVTRQLPEHASRRPGQPGSVGVIAVSTSFSERQAPPVPTAKAVPRSATFSNAGSYGHVGTAPVGTVTSMASMTQALGGPKAVPGPGAVGAPNGQVLAHPVPAPPTSSGHASATCAAPRSQSFSAYAHVQKPNGRPGYASTPGSVLGPAPVQQQQQPAPVNLRRSPSPQRSAPHHPAHVSTRMQPVSAVLSQPLNQTVNTHSQMPAQNLEMSQRMARANDLQARLAGGGSPHGQVPATPNSRMNTFGMQAPNLLTWAKEHSENSEVHGANFQSRLRGSSSFDQTMSGEAFGFGLHHLPPPPRSAPAAEGLPSNDGGLPPSTSFSSAQHGGPVLPPPPRGAPAFGGGGSKDNDMCCGGFRGRGHGGGGGGGGSCGGNGANTKRRESFSMENQGPPRGTSYAACGGGGAGAAEFHLKVLTSDNRWETLTFRSSDRLDRVGQSFLNRHGLKGAFHAGLVAKMQSMIQSGQSTASVDIVDLI
eukprot:TRINITY_DN11310_c0_g2_i1.p1 TRINITY_DN11310_c0_g2~~TRINITY_DN11310_c0_g2_i1.p1  ORF type:complete len:1622 (+),score=331.74 TRINITY_DN11310_c0_g2_i1:190-5055(+)